MIAGLPGTAISGFFYLLTALLMPLVEIVYTIQGKSNWTRWTLVAKETGFASGIFLVMWGVFWLLAFALQRFKQAGWVHGTHWLNWSLLRVTPLTITLALLAALLVGIELLTLTLRKTRRSANPR